MHYTTIRNPIHLVYRDGSIHHTFSGWDQLLHYWPHFCRCDIGPGPSHKKVWPNWNTRIREYFRALDRGEQMVYHHDYILRDSFGDTIDPAVVRDAYNKRHPYRSKYHWVPGSKRRGRGHYYRHPRTTQERRWAKAWDDEEYAPKTRARRNYRNLPSAWDDIPHHDWGYRNWKHYRRHQWKEKR